MLDKASAFSVLVMLPFADAIITLQEAEVTPPLRTLSEPWTVIVALPTIAVLQTVSWELVPSTENPVSQCNQGSLYSKTLPQRHPTGDLENHQNFTKQET